MSLETNLRDLVTAIATDIKTLRAADGNLAALTTTEKTNFVGALNELRTLVLTQTSINDAVTDTTHTWSSSKIAAYADAVATAIVGGAPGALDALNELAAALGNDPNFAATMAAALGSRVRTDTATQGLNSTQQSNARTNIAAASQAALDTLTTNVGPTTTDFVAVYTAAKA